MGGVGLRMSVCGLRVSVYGLGVTSTREGAAIEELFLLKTSQTRRLDECQWLVGLDLAANVRRQPRHEAAQQEGWGESDDAVRQFLKFGEVLGHRTPLSKLEQDAGRVLILGRSEPGLNRLKKSRPRRELAIVVHPLEPSQRTAIHVECSNGKSLCLWG